MNLRSEEVVLGQGTLRPDLIESASGLASNKVSSPRPSKKFLKMVFDICINYYIIHFLPTWTFYAFMQHADALWDTAKLWIRERCYLGSEVKFKWREFLLIGLQADVIKTHHNDTELVRKLRSNNQVVEPLTEFHKVTTSFKIHLLKVSLKSSFKKDSVR